MQGERFAQDPIGTYVDPEQLIAAGAPERHPRSCTVRAMTASSRRPSRRTCGSRSPEAALTRTGEEEADGHLDADDTRADEVGRVEYFKRFDRGATCSRCSADDADVYFPKWAVNARGKDEIARCFGDVAQLFHQQSCHHPSTSRCSSRTTWSSPTGNHRWASAPTA